MQPMSQQKPERVNVFFYGLFMDETLLQSKGIHPQNICVAKADGYSLHIGERATLIQDFYSHVYGILMSLTHKEIDLLYSDESVRAYRPEPVILSTNDGRIVTALCFNLAEPPLNNESNSIYTEKLKTLSKKLALPDEYICSIR